MIYLTLLTAGVLISAVHAYLVWKNYDGVKYSISEHAISDKKSYSLYLSAHVVTDVLLTIYAYLFFFQVHNQNLLFILTIIFIILDFLQAVLPAKNKTESVHFMAAYFSWFLYQLVGILSLFWLNIAQPLFTLSILTLVPVLAMFIFMHFKRNKLWPFQLLMVPVYVLSLLFITIGSM